jgi:phosphoserine phosphatase RsbU/P
MRILIADDEGVTRFILKETLRDWGYDVIVVADGQAACDHLLGPHATHVALLDWEMPGMCGPDICRRLRLLPTDQPPYLILLTGRDKPEDLALGLESGANDYLTKPFHKQELAARLSVAVRTVQMQQNLTQRVRELEQALAQVKQLTGMLPICAWCKKIRNDQNYWTRVEEYITDHSEVTFSHGICPTCLASEMVKGGKAPIPEAKKTPSPEAP